MLADVQPECPSTSCLPLKEYVWDSGPGCGSWVVVGYSALGAVHCAAPTIVPVPTHFENMQRFVKLAKTFPTGATIRGAMVSRRHAACCEVQHLLPRSCGRGPPKSEEGSHSSR